jgi:hypothetical protein
VGEGCLCNGEIRERKLDREVARLDREDFLDKQESKGTPRQGTWEFFLKQREKYDNELKAKGYPWKR